MDQNLSHEHLLLVQAWESVFAGSSIIYLSGPITTGPRFVEWYEKVGKSIQKNTKSYAAAHRQDVIIPNSTELKRYAAELREIFHQPVLEPATLHIEDWSQKDYLTLWDRVIDRYASHIIVAPGWNYSAGCTAELYRGFTNRLNVQTIEGRTINLSEALSEISEALDTLNSARLPLERLHLNYKKLETLQKEHQPARVNRLENRAIRKDESLDRLADKINVAQFISYSPGPNGPRQEFSRVIGSQPNEKFGSLEVAIGTLLENSPDRSINIRTFTPENPQSREFLYGLQSVDQAVSAINRFNAEGLNIIANETVDVNDGGVSGVLMGDVIEFAPDTTPRGVEKAGIATFPRHWGLDVLRTVYRFEPDLVDVPHASRLEFSIHPKRRGWRHTHTLGWEYSETDFAELEPKLSWPNSFSKMLGDKAFGLLIAHVLNLPVPRTVVVNRRVPPFWFGRPTGSYETWIRTCPNEQVPGKYTTNYGWQDPFKLLSNEDPQNENISSILSQDSIEAHYSGAAIVTADGEVVIEGVKGQGDALMKGVVSHTTLPSDIYDAVGNLHERASKHLGDVRFEWVHDGTMAWIVQLHRGATQSTSEYLVPGEASEWLDFDVSLGLEELREKLAHIDSDTGLKLSGEVGLTSHIADVIRRAGVPARICSS